MPKFKKSKKKTKSPVTTSKPLSLPKPKKQISKNPPQISVSNVPIVQNIVTWASIFPQSPSLGPSFNGKCDAFTPSNSQISCSECKSSEHNHILNGDETWIKIRNLRALASWNLPNSNPLQNIIDRADTWLPPLLDLLPEQIPSAQNLINHYKSSQSPNADLFHFAIQLISHLDDLYWKIYFNHFQNRSSRLPCPPPPHVYFPSFSIPSPNHSNFNLLHPYLQYFTAIHSQSLQIPFHSFYQSHPPQPLYEGTMRGSDPILPPPIRTFLDASRDNAARFYAFPVPPHDSEIKRIVNTYLKPSSASSSATPKLLEIACGTGYWAHVFSTHCNVIATNASHDSYHPRFIPQWTKHIIRCDARDAVARYVDAVDALLVTYPPPDVDFVTPLITPSSTKTLPKKIILVGEFAGDTGTRQLETTLWRHWRCIEDFPLPNFAHTVYSLTIWVPKATPADDANVWSISDPNYWPLSCALCGAFPSLPKAPNGKKPSAKHTAKDGEWARDRYTRRIVCCPSCMRNSSSSSDLASRVLDACVKTGLMGGSEKDKRFLISAGRKKMLRSYPLLKDE